MCADSIRPNPLEVNGTSVSKVIVISRAVTSDFDHLFTIKRSNGIKKEVPTHSYILNEFKAMKFCLVWPLFFHIMASMTSL